VRFDWPVVLVALVLIPLALLAYLLVERRRARYAIKFTNLDVLASVLPSSGTAQKRRFIPPLVFALAIAAALIGVARPAVSRNVAREQATVILVIDTSGSMVANDVEPSRLVAAQDAVRKFIGKLPGRFRVGMISFSSQARVAMPITEDRDLAKQGVENLNAFGGTAIGDAIGRSLELLQESGRAAGVNVLPSGSKTPPAAIVLLSDGAQNRGRLQPIQAALRAKELKVPVYTVALGTPNGSIKINDGSFTTTVSVPPDPQTLRQIALETGGQFYSAASSARLNAVYGTLASRLATRKEYTEATNIFLGAAAFLLVAAGVASFLWLPRLP
jgi:Ca-activated chloride channel family protein